MPVDQLTRFTDGYITRTATGQNDLDLGTTTQRTRKPLWARINYYAASASGGSSPSVLFSIQCPDDNGTYVNRRLANAIALPAAAGAKSGTIWIDLLGLPSELRLVATFAGGGTPTITYSGTVVDSQG